VKSSTFQEKHPRNKQSNGPNSSASNCPMMPSLFDYAPKSKLKTFELEVQKGNFVVNKHFDESEGEDKRLAKIKKHIQDTKMLKTNSNLSKSFETYSSHPSLFLIVHIESPDNKNEIQEEFKDSYFGNRANTRNGFLL
jgi:hypothetical protein